jgi:DNA-binding NtrC family response regulator
VTLKEQLDRLVEEMVTRGVRFPDAQREFEHRFIARVVAETKGNLGRAATTLGIHRNTLSRKMFEHRIKRHV